MPDDDVRPDERSLFAGDVVALLPAQGREHADLRVGAKFHKRVEDGLSRRRCARIGMTVEDEYLLHVVNSFRWPRANRVRGFFLLAIFLTNADRYSRFPLNFLTDFLNAIQKRHKTETLAYTSPGSERIRSGRSRQRG